MTSFKKKRDEKPSTYFITCHAFLFFARTSFDILGHLTVSSYNVTVKALLIGTAISNNIAIKKPVRMFMRSAR